MSTMNQSCTEKNKKSQPKMAFAFLYHIYLRFSLVYCEVNISLSKGYTGYDMADVLNFNQTSTIMVIT